MGATKTDHFSERQNKLATLTKAMAHPARIAIIDYLLKVDACICGEIVNELPLSQPTVSQHLKELKNAGIIRGSIEGNSICYCIDKENWSAFQSMLNNFFNNSEKKNNCC
jgi:ArsR family transcriptional regulator